MFHRDISILFGFTIILMRNFVINWKNIMFDWLNCTHCTLFFFFLQDKIDNWHQFQFAKDEYVRMPPDFHHLFIFNGFHIIYKRCWWRGVSYHVFQTIESWYSACCTVKVEIAARKEQFKINKDVQHEFLWRFHHSLANENAYGYQ